MNTWEQKYQNAPPPPVFIQSEPNFMICKVVMREYSYKVLGDLSKTKNFMALWNIG